jgi:two-component system, NarL family, invasion response regulator UvrY
VSLRPGVRLTEVATDPASVGEPGSAPSRVGVLTVDDEPFFRNAAQELIGATAGFVSVGVAVCGEQAVTLVGEREPDLVLVDMNMPGIDGVETTRQIKATHPGVVVVVMSADGAAIPRAEAASAGVVAFLSKQDFTPRLLGNLWVTRGDW